jgi:hypothetical protein
MGARGKAKLRFTGEWPPQDLWDRYPNWEYALDEEDVEGQDETTLRPAKEQKFLTEDLAFTAGEVLQANNLRLPAILELSECRVVGVTAFTNPKDGWTVRALGNPPRWVCIVEDWLTEDERRPSVSFDQKEVFPIKVVSRLPAGPGLQPLNVRIASDGSITQLD